MSGWRLQDTHVPIDASAAAQLRLTRATEQQNETWFEHDDGQLLAIVAIMPADEQLVRTVLERLRDAAHRNRNDETDLKDTPR
ncbi:MAG: hypothetical protein ABMA25_04590 [Ilumatobacteraceae bacterium]